MLKKSSPSLLQALISPLGIGQKWGQGASFISLRRLASELVVLVPGGSHRRKIRARGWPQAHTSSGTKERRFLQQHPSPSECAGREGAAFCGCVEVHAATRGATGAISSSAGQGLEAEKVPGLGTEQAVTCSSEMSHKPQHGDNTWDTRRPDPSIPFPLFFPLLGVAFALVNQAGHWWQGL